MPLFGGSSVGMSVYYDDVLERYIALYIELGLSDTILSRESQFPEGPWSDPVVRFICPEPSSDENYFTYMALAHPNIKDDHLVVTYCTNSFDFNDMFTNLDLYYPQFIVVDMHD